MLLTIRNISLDDVFDQYNTTNLMSLTKDQLIKIAVSLGASVVTTEEGYFDKGETVDNIIRANTYNFNLPRDYWSEELTKEIVESPENKKKLTMPGTGDVTHKLFSQYGIGVYDLGPAEEQTIDVPEEAIDEWLMKLTPFVSNDKTKAKLIVANRASGAKKEEQEVPTHLKPLTDKSMSELIRIAKEVGVTKVVGLSKVQLATEVINKGWKAS